MIKLDSGEFVVSGWASLERGIHYAITNRGKLWLFSHVQNKWELASP